MRRFLYLILAAMIVLSAASAYAITQFNAGQRVKTHIVSAAYEAVSSSTISTSNRLLGYTYTDSSAGRVSIYDSASVSGVTATNVIVEDGVIAGSSVTIWFPYPVDITAGIAVVQTANTGRVTLYYE